jgi:ParB/RepB/Spo0J family partition protein
MNLNEVDKIYEVPLNQIKITNDRYRKDMGDVGDLAESIKSYGQLIPIIISEDYTLIAGERRCKAHELLGMETIRACIRTTEEINNRVIEIIENKDRKDFTWQEQVMAMDDLHRMMVALKGPDWSLRNTAKKIGVSKSGVISDVDLANALKESPDIFEGCDSKKKAIKALQQYKIDETMAEISLRESRKDYSKHARNHVFLGDCTKLIDKIPDGLINAVISDPFYGIEIDSTKKFDRDEKVSKIYDDSEDLYKSVMSTLVKKLPRVLSKDAWVVFFCAIQHFPWLHSTMTDIGFKCDIIPAIWYKTGTTGQCNQPQSNFARVYEAFIYGRKGEPPMIKQGQPNILVHQVVHSMDKDHPVEKPTSLLEEIISRFCLPGHVILDPMSGSGSTLVAAVRRGCNPIGFELDERYYNICVKNVSEILKIKDAGKMDLAR